MNMKTIKFFILSLLMITATIGQAQSLNPQARVHGTTFNLDSPNNLNYANPAKFGGGAQPQGGPPRCGGLVQIVPAAAASETTPEIQALARGLENDPARIFAYVHDHIRHVLYYGENKGAQLTLLERCGNDFDQCALLVTLLQAAGYTNGPGYDHGVGYQYGVVKIPYDSPDHNDLHHWLALSLVNTNWTNTTNYLGKLLAQRGYPIMQNYSFLSTPAVSWFDEDGSNTLAFQHVWVTITTGAVTNYFDPAFKISEPIVGTSLSTTMGLTSNTLMTVAGGTDNSNYVQGVAEGALRGQLQSYNSNLLAAIQSSGTNASVQQILGGEQIIPWTNGLSLTRPFSIDTRGGLYPLLTWSNVPMAFMSTLQMQLSSGSAFAVTNWIYASLKGQRLSITCVTNGIAQVWLNDAPIFSITNLDNNTFFQVQITAKHPSWGWDTNQNIPVDTSLYPYIDQCANYGMDTANPPISCLWTNSSYAFIYGFDPNIKWLNERSQQLAAYRQQALGDTSRQVVTESLNMLGLSWMIQTELTQDILDQQLGQLPEYLEQFGFVGQENGNGYFVNFFFSYDQSYPNSGANAADLENNQRAFNLGGFFASAMEHGVIEQFQTNGMAGVSTIKILQLANTNNQPIYLANNYTWTNVQPQLTNYSGAFVATLAADVFMGDNILLPANETNQIGGWAGYGMLVQQFSGTSESVGFIIGADLYGGYTSDLSATVSLIAGILSSAFGVTLPTFADPAPLGTPQTKGGDPVNMADAAFQINTTDLSLGHAEPLGLTLGRYYTPSRQHVNLAAMADGWVNSYYFNLSEVSAPEASLGSTTPAQMAPMLAATCAAVSLYSPAPEAKNWLVTALIAKWGIDQTINKAVSIELGNDIVEFIKQPDGSFTPPANNTMTLTNIGGSYQLQLRHGNTFLFNTNKQLSQITNPSGDSLLLTYTGGLLT